MKNSSSPLIFLQRTLITPLLISAYKSLISLSQKSKILELLRQIFTFFFFFVLNLINTLPLSLPFSLSTGTHQISKFDAYHADNHKQLVRSQDSNGRVSVSDTAIARAMDQLLMLLNDIPVSSRKYEVVRCLMEKLIDDNLKERCEVLREVNCVVLSEAFGRALNGLETELLGQTNDVGFGLGRVVSLVKGWGGIKESGGPCGVDTVFAEKMAAELLWLAQKMEASGGGEVVVEKWAWASNLGWLALSSEPRVQASLVKLTAFLIKQAKQIGKQQQQTEGEKWERLKPTLMKMLMTWIPLLCQASNGSDAPTLSMSDRGDVERGLEEIINMLEDSGCQEKVLSLWLHHFTHSPFSDWPNLYASYIKWCTISSKLLVTR